MPDVNSTNNMQKSTNVDISELAKFDRIAHQWWDKEGQFKPLHQMNPVRANYIDSRSSVAGKKLLDVGCGGGLLSEAMAHRGAIVTGIDLAEEPLQVAKLHAKSTGLDIRYKKTSAEDLVADQADTFDVVTCLELLEHVPNPASVVEACFNLVRPGGDVYFSTINRNIKSYALAVFAAEYVLKWVPKGTHEYKKFIRPSELTYWARCSGLIARDISGIVYNPLTQKFSLSAKDVDCNYIIHFQKPSQ